MCLIFTKICFHVNLLKIFKGKLHKKFEADIFTEGLIESPQEIIDLSQEIITEDGFEEWLSLLKQLDTSWDTALEIFYLLILSSGQTINYFDLLNELIKFSNV